MLQKTAMSMEYYMEKIVLQKIYIQYWNDMLFTSHLRSFHFTFQDEYWGIKSRGGEYGWTNGWDNRSAFFKFLTSIDESILPFFYHCKDKLIVKLQLHTPSSTFLQQWIMMTYYNFLSACCSQVTKIINKDIWLWCILVLYCNTWRKVRWNLST